MEATAPNRFEGIAGRDEELAVLADFLAPEQEKLALTIEGEAGIGKTTLWRACITLADAESYLVLSCRPAPAEVRLSYAALGDLLGDVIANALPDLPEPQRHALAVALLLEEPRARAPAKRAIGVALLSLLCALARDQPVLLAVDDVQWLDRPSATVLEFAARRLEGRRVKLLLATRRENEPQAASSFVEVLPVDVRAQLAVGPLSLGALHRVIRSRLGAALPRPTLVRVHEIAAGNPFYAVEIAKAMAARSAGPYDEPALVPASLLDLVAVRVAGLPRRVRAVLEVVAALSDATVTTVEAALPGKRVDLALERAVAAAVLEREGERIRFAHPLLAAAVVRDVDAERRRRLHRTLAGIVTDPEEQAHHLALATSRPDPRVAAKLEAAATTACERGALEAAAELAEQAIRVTPPHAGEVRWRRGVLAAEYHFKRGDMTRARTLLEEVVAEAQGGTVRASALHWLGHLAFYDEGPLASTNLLQAALHEAKDDQRLTGRIHKDLVEKVGVGGDWIAARVHAEAAIDLARELDDDELFRDALPKVWLTGFYLGHGIPSSMNDAASVDAIFTAARILKWADRFDESRRMFQRLEETYLEEGGEYIPPLFLYHLSELESWSGNFGIALAHAEAGLELAEQTGQDVMRPPLLYSVALAGAHLGRVDAARQALAEGLAAAERAGAISRAIQHLAVLGFLELSLGRWSPARRHLSRALQLASAEGVVEPGVYRFMPDAIEVLVDVGDLGRAGSLTDELEASGLLLDRRWALATAKRCRAIIEAEQGRLEAALALLENAVSVHEQLPMPFELGRTLLIKGAIERRARRRRAARDSLEQALTVFERLGTPLWSKRARAELGHISGRPRASDALTGTQQRVATLVAEGQTNREVAASLFVSERTVEGHLTRIYGKLGIRSRTELARHFARVPH